MLSNVDPGRESSVEDLIKLEPQSQIIKDFGVTDGGNKIEAKVDLIYSLFAQLNIYGRDISPETYPFKIFVIPANDQNDLQKKIAGIKENRKKTKNSISDRIGNFINLCLSDEKEIWVYSNSWSVKEVLEGQAYIATDLICGNVSK